MPVRTILLALLGAVLLVPVATSGPAHAAGQPCTVSHTVAGGPIRPELDAGKDHSWNPFVIRVQDARTVVDLDVSYNIDHPAAQGLSVHLLGPRTSGLSPNVQTLNRGTASGTLRGLFAFDDEAGTTTLQGSDPLPGRYLPATPAAALEGGTGTGSWSLWVLNYSGQAGTLGAFTVTLTYATCDSDGDAVDDRVDLCPHAADPDQRDMDGDGFGDACDLDPDGDAVAGTADRCPALPGTSSAGCPAADRKVRLSHSSRKDALAVTVSSLHAECRARARGTLWRIKPGRDAKVGPFRTDRSGRAKLDAPRRPGRYRVEVLPRSVAGVVECRAARSPAVRVTAR